MTKLRPLLFFFLSLLWQHASLAQSALVRCNTSAVYEQALREHPEILTKVNAIEAFTERWVNTHEEGVGFREVITIPVVIHVVYRTEEENISDEQILSQFEVLNKDYRALNEEIVTVAQGFQDDIADVELEFCLAKRDPDGNATTGILRTHTDNVNIGGSTAIYHTSSGGDDAWDEAHYLNIWVTELPEGFLGYAKYPGTAAPGEDGVVISYHYFGTTGTAANSYPYNKGRTTTHEIGHYFNLLHVWGDSEDCSSSDHVVDTPSSSVTYINTCPFTPQFSCGSQDMHMDFMYYTDDACMGMFTKGQKLRMMATLNGPRAGLLTSNGCDPVSDIPTKALSVSVYPNPTTGQLFLDFTTPVPEKIQVELYEMTGKKIRTRTFDSGNFHVLNIASFPSGLYFLKIKSVRLQIDKKIILR